MKPPNSFSVLGRRYSIASVHGLKAEDGTYCLGITNIDDQTIQLELDQGPDSLSETYLHEVLHCLHALTGVRHDLTEKKEEAMVKRMAPVLLHFLRTNPRVVYYLTAKEKS